MQLKQQIEERKHLETLELELANYFARSSQRFSVPLVYLGTPFKPMVDPRGPEEGTHGR